MVVKEIYGELIKVMKVAIIGRTEYLYNTAEDLFKNNHEIKVIVTAKAAPEYKRCEEDFKELALRLNAHFFKSTTLDSPEIITALNGLDTGISVNWINIIKEKHIKLFRHGILNAHLGDLPRYRGNACPNWAIIQGEKEVVLTIHLMEGDILDSGRIIVQEKYQIDTNTYIGDIYLWAEKSIPQAFLKALSLLKKDPGFTLKYADPNSPVSFRCYPRRPEDSEIDWYQPAESIHRIIRASSRPLHGAYTYYHNKKLVIWRASLIKDDSKFLAIPGQIADINEDGSVSVITGKGKLKIDDLEYDGLRNSPSYFIKSIRERLGS
jgi:methionyl-tRNA formyltransferase